MEAEKEAAAPSSTSPGPAPEALAPPPLKQTQPEQQTTSMTPHEVRDAAGLTYVRTGNVCESVHYAPDTWADFLHSYDAEKRSPHPGLFQPQPPRFTAAFMAMEDRSYDPITGQFRDPNERAALEKWEEDRAHDQRNRAKDVQLLRSQPFNIINNEGDLPPNKVHTLKFRPKAVGGQPPPQHSWNIVTNLPNEFHTMPGEESKDPTGTGMVSSAGAKSFRARSLPPKRGTRLVPHTCLREWDIVSNLYLDEHDKKTAEENNALRLEATAAFQKQRKYNLLTCKYHDPEEETRIQGVEKQLVALSTEKAKDLMPYFTHFRPQNHYNLLSNQVTNGEVLARLDAAEASKKDRYYTKHRVDVTSKDWDFKHQHQKATRSLNRICPERWNEQLSRGFDIVNHRNFKGLGAIPPPQPRVYYKVPLHKTVTRKGAVPEGLRGRGALVMGGTVGASGGVGASGVAPAAPQTEAGS